MSLITPDRDPDRWKEIPGENNCIGRDVIPEELFNISNCHSLFFSKTSRKIALGFELIKKDSNGKPLVWTLWPGASYRALLPHVSIPKDCYAIISPRSTLSKLGIICPSAAMLDPGFSGHPYMLLFSSLHCQIEPGTALFSARLFLEQDLKPYHGHYQEA